MSAIYEKQNEPEMLRLLAAQRQLYDEEKRNMSIWLVVVFITGFLGTGLAGLADRFMPEIVFFSLLVVLLEFAILPRIEQKRALAAKIQEWFDCKLFDLPWNEALTPPPDKQFYQEINSAVARFEKRKNAAQDWESLRNWYTNPFLQTLPEHQARVACQLENVRWDSGQRRAWIQVIVGVVIALIVLILGIGMIMNWQLQDFFGVGMLLSLPLWVLAAEHVRAHRQAAERLDYLKIVGRELCHEAGKTNSDPAELLRRTRELQSEIYHHRKEDVPVFSWFYRIHGQKGASIAITDHVDPCLL